MYNHAIVQAVKHDSGAGTRRAMSQSYCCAYLMCVCVWRMAVGTLAVGLPASNRGTHGWLERVTNRRRLGRDQHTIRIDSRASPRRARGSHALARSDHPITRAINHALLEDDQCAGRERRGLPPVPQGLASADSPQAPLHPLLDELLRQHLSTPFNPRTTATPACPPLYPAMTQIPLAPSTATTPPTSPPPPPKVTAHLGMRAAPGGPS